MASTANGGEEEPRTVSVEEASRALGISREHGYALARRRELPGLIVLGHRYVVSRAALQRVLNGEPER
jgi:excisionase family DNA binding protein